MVGTIGCCNRLIVRRPEASIGAVVNEGDVSMASGVRVQMLVRAVRRMVIHHHERRRPVLRQVPENGIECRPDSTSAVESDNGYAQRRRRPFDLSQCA